LEEKFNLLTKRFEEFTARFDEPQPMTRKKGGRNKSVAGRFQEFTERFEESSEPLAPKKGGKKTQKVKSASLTEQINFEAAKRLREFLKENHLTQPDRERRSDPTPSTSFANFDESYSTTSNLTDDLSDGPTTKNIFIRRIDCLLNSVPIDQIEDKQTGNTLLMMIDQNFLLLKTAINLKHLPK
jgi:hypothetical protein